jgi:ketosteroid isomerase-like protein
MPADEQRILELHEGFRLANTHEDTEWLQAHIMPDVTWFNLNKSNYFGDAHIIALWKRLYEERPDKSKEAMLTVTDRHVTVTEGMGLVAYTMTIDYDFGEFAQFHASGRATEVWLRSEGDYRLVHFHCSEHEPGIMGGT